MRGYRFARAFKFVFVAAIVLGIVTFIAMTLWNWLVPALFTGPPITFWQALGLLVLSRLLFGGLRPRGPFGHGPCGHGPFTRGRHPFHGHWKRMTPEERAHLRERLRRHRGFGRPPHSTETHV